MLDIKKCLVILMLSTSTLGSILFDAQIGVERSNIESETTTHAGSPLNGIFNQIGVGLSLNFIPMFSLPILAHYSWGSVHQKTNLGAHENTYKVDNSVGLVVRPTFKVGDGRLFMTAGVDFFDLLTSTDSANDAKTKYIMPYTGGGVSYLILPSVEIYTEAKWYARDNKTIKSGGTTGISDFDLNYAKFRLSIGVLASLL